MRRLLRKIVVSVFLLLLTIGSVSAGLTDALPELDDVQRWSVFTLGSTSLPDQIAGNTVIQGDVGVAGVGNLALQNRAVIQGDLYSGGNGTLAIDPNAHVLGIEFQNQDSFLANEAAAAMAASNHAASLTPNFLAPLSIQLTGNNNFTATGAPGANVVLQLANFTLKKNSSFTLEGTASTVFIINVTTQFSLTGKSRIVLSGGVQWSNVLFNVTGMGSAVSITKNASFSGMLMATRRTAQLSGRATVTGEVVADRVMFTKTKFNGSATVTHPAIVSP